MSSCGALTLTFLFYPQMTALAGNCIKVLGHGPLRVNAKSKNMITCKTSKLTSKTKIFHIYSAVSSKKLELSILAFHKLYIDGSSVVQFPADMFCIDKGPAESAQKGPCVGKACQGGSRGKRTRPNTTDCDPVPRQFPADNDQMPHANEGLG